MTWVKLSDTFAEDPRLEEAGPLALALHVAALCYCARQLTDGKVPRRTMRRLLDLDGPAGADAVAAQLVATGLWAETADGFELVDYLRDQPSREHVESVRQKKAAAGRVGGRASGESRRTKTEPNVKQSASPVVEHPNPNPNPNPNPTTTNAREPADAGDLVTVALDRLPDQVLPDRGRLLELCVRLADDGWTAAHLEGWIKRQHWPPDAKPGLTVHRLQNLKPDDQRAPNRRSSSTSNGPKCPHGIGLSLDGYGCPACPAEPNTQHRESA